MMRSIKMTSVATAMMLALLVATTAVSEVPEQLPSDPSVEPAPQNKPVQVFILMGQSNMLGKGKVGPKNKEGTLSYLTKKKGKYSHLVDDDGNWTVRKDVRYVHVMSSGTGNMKVVHNTWLKPDGNHIGPELQFGHVMGEVIDAPVLLVKSCIGNRSLGWDLLPPGSEQFEYNGNVYAGYKDSPLKWKKGTDPDPINWYAGKQYDGDTRNAKRVLKNIKKYYPGYQGQGFEIAGFLWWQGDKDRYDAGHAQRYEHNLVNLIKALRKDFNAPDAKFVCATLGQTEKGAGGNEGKILDAMFAVSNPDKYPEFKGNVATVYTHPLSQGGASNSHYNGNAQTYLDVGGAMGLKMMKLLKD